MNTKRFHIIIDLKDVSNKILNDRSRLKIFLTNLTESIGMHILSGPVVVKGIRENPGFSGFVLIDFSHISVHTFTEQKEALVDIFSCKPYQQKIVEKEALKYFQVSKANARIQVVHWG